MSQPREHQLGRLDGWCCYQIQKGPLHRDATGGQKQELLFLPIVSVYLLLASSHRDLFRLYDSHTYRNTIQPQSAMTWADEVRNHD